MHVKVESSHLGICTPWTFVGVAEAWDLLLLEMLLSIKIPPDLVIVKPVLDDNCLLKAVNPGLGLRSRAHLSILLVTEPMLEFVQHPKSSFKLRADVHQDSPRLNLLLLTHAIQPLGVGIHRELP